MDGYDLVFFKSEMQRAFDVLGEKGELQNLLDIDSWLKQGLITDEVATILKAYNSECHALTVRA